MPTAPTNPVTVFYSYAHEDEALREKLKKQLASLKRQELISEWYDRDISPGNEWNEEIDKHLNSASVILLLISPDFIDSDYCNDVEVKRAMERHQEGSAKVIPVILRATNWKGLPFSKLQALPTDGRPVTSWPNQDEAFLDIATGIETAINELNSDSAPGSTSHLSPLAHIEPESAIGFVARKDRDGNDLIDQLRIELAPRSSRVVALWGAGGVGKTALAAQAVRSLIDDYQQRVAWISADGRDEFALPNLLDEISNQFGRPELRTLGLEPKKQAAYELATESPSLIILDNFETVNPKEQLRCLEWLTRLSPSSVLITTRDKIELPAIRNIPIKSMLAPEAHEFLDRLVRQAQHQHTFEHIDKERLIETAEANPLILQWVFAQIDLAQDWQEVLNELAQGEGDAAHRVFDRSFNLAQLNNGGRAALLALSLFVPSASRIALAEVAGLSGDKNKNKFREATKHLAALWLIRTIDDGTGGTRLTVEGLTRDLAKARLGSDQRSVGIRQRFITRFTNFVTKNSGESLSDLNALETERENLLAAIDIASTTNNWNYAIAIYVGIANFLDIRGYWDDVLRRGNRLRSMAIDIKNNRALGFVAERVAYVRMARGEYAEAEHIYKEALELFRALNSHKDIGNPLFNLGQLANRRGDFHQARQFFNETIAIEEKLGNKGAISNTLHALGRLTHTEGELTEARRLYRASMEIKENLNDQRRMAILLGDLGALDEEEGNIDQARQLYSASLDVQKKLGDQRFIASSLANLAALAKQQGDFSEALKLYNESGEIDKKLGNLQGQAESLHQLGLLAWDQGKKAEARQLLEQSLEIERRLGNPIAIATGLHDLGALDLEEGVLENAESFLNQSFDIFRDLKAKKYLAECLELQGRLKTAQSSFAEAREAFDEALEIAETLRQKSIIASIKHSAGLLAEKENDLSLAKTLFRESLEIYESLGFAKAETVKGDLQRLEH